MEIITLQDAINAKAEKRMKDSCEKICNFIRNEYPFSDFIGKYYCEIEGKKESLRALFWDDNSTLFLKYKEFIKEDVIASESKRFLDELESLKSQVDDLLSRG